MLPHKRLCTQGPSRCNMVDMYLLLAQSQRAAGTASTQRVGCVHEFQGCLHHSCTPTHLAKV